ncbi:TetR/AcrR family transcriptional regulator [Streptomyces sp. NBC_00690]|uniref:TetR/AcrR family transcriptional regulator n=1 Tax=Streptomyces sp. NBC_00690 TaxID=2975808 RepID=UPI002E2CAF1B|nr:helix-turn-helix domain-containing protein [Streptomyces sp. NBC_00690]
MCGGLAEVAFDPCRSGFDKVTLDDLASAAGVSRSTFLRQSRSKEETALGAFDAQGEKLAAVVRDRPAAEDGLDSPAPSDLGWVRQEDHLEGDTEPSCVRWNPGTVRPQ